MKHNFLKNTFMALTVAMLMSMLIVCASAAELPSGTTDTGFAWSVSECESGYLLTISDTEASKELDTFTWTLDGKSPAWNVKLEYGGYRAKITELVYEASASKIGGYALGNLQALKKITVPSTVTALGNNAFYDSKYLVTFAVAGEELGDYTVNFKHMTDLTDSGTYKYLLQSCFISASDYKVYLSNSAVLYSPYNGFANFNSGDIFYVDEDYPYLTKLNTLATRYGFAVEYYPKADSAMEMYGYQVRTEGYNGLRGIFNFNENVKNEGFTLVEYGAILVADANRGTDDANIKLSYNNETGEYEPAGERIVKKAIKQNGAYAPGAKTLKKLNGENVEDIEGYNENYTWFATTLIEFDANYKDDVYMCGYEIWESDTTGDINIVYTGYSEKEHESQSIYDVSVEMLAVGVTNDLENNPIGSVVKAAGAATLTDADATLPTGVTSLVAENIEMMPYASGAFSAGTTYYSLYEMENGNYLVYISGEGNLNAAALRTTYASDFAGETRPVPTLLDATYNKITHMVIGEGIVDISSFKSMNKLVSIIYPQSLKSVAKVVSTNVFQYCSVLEKIVPVGMVTDEKIFEFGGIKISDNNLIQWSFQGCPAVEYIHLNGFRAGNDYFYGCSKLKAVWIGNTDRPADGVADFRNCSAAKLDMGSFTNTACLNTLLLSDTITALAKSDYGFTTTTIYQATAIDAIATFCASGDPKTVATYTQTLPQ